MNSNPRKLKSKTRAPVSAAPPLSRSLDEAKIPFTALFFAITLIACTIIRFLQYAVVVRTDNGFFEYDGGFLNHAYYIFLAIFAVGIVALAILDKRAKRGFIHGGKIGKVGKKLTATSAVVGAVWFAASGFALTLEVINLLSGKASFVIILTAILAAFGFLLAGYMIFVKKSLPPVVAIAFVMVSVFFVSAAATEFRMRVYTIHLSSRLIYLLVNILAALFFLACGRIIVRSENRFTAVLCTLYGYSAALLIFSDGLARIFYYLAGGADLRGQLLANTNGFELPSALFFVPAFVILWTIYVLSRGRRKDGMKSETVEDDGNVEVVENDAQEY